MEAIYYKCPYCDDIHHSEYRDEETGEVVDDYEGDIKSTTFLSRPCNLHIGDYVGDYIERTEGKTISEMEVN